MSHLVPPHLAEHLRLTREDLDISLERRVTRINEAIDWETGTKDEPEEHIIWSAGQFEVSLLKPGKEALPEWSASGKRRPNPNDMRPLVKHLGIPQPNASFTDIFGELINCRPQPELGRLLGTLLVRSAFMADHVVVDGKWRYVPQTHTVAEIEAQIPSLYKVSLTAFLHYLDALGWNEDVKYFTIRKKNGEPYDLTRGAGRPNNVLTCAHFIAADIGAVSWADVLGPLAQLYGVSPIGMPEAYAAFPLLGTYIPPARGRRRRG